MEFSNSYQDARRAAAYARMEFPGTYHLAYRDLPAILARHARGKKAVDFGCGTGRSTRFLKRLGFQAVGVDIAPEMLALAGERDPGGDYRLIRDDGFGGLEEGAFDVVLSAFTFDNIPAAEKEDRFTRMKERLNASGVIVNLVSSPEIYTHEWASFSTRDYPENKTARSGDIVRIVQTDTEDRRPVEDILWTQDAYRRTYAGAGLRIVRIYRPLARGDEPFRWISEKRVAPWVITVLKKGASAGRDGRPS